jgi:glycosyltransferase involved in cell wall biosynthesis
MKKILVAGQTFYRSDNGQAAFTIQLAEGLANAGYDVLVLAPSDTGESYRSQQRGVTLQTVPALDLGHNVNVTALTDRRVSRTLAAFQPDIVHLQDHYFLSRSVLRAARRRSLTVVGTNHFLPENLLDNLRVPGRWRAIASRLLWDNMLSVYNQLAAVTAPTPTAVAILQQQPLRIPVQAISCGVDTGRFRPRPALDRAALRHQYGLALDKHLFLYVGRVDREKGLAVMAKAMAALPRDDVQFVVAGRGRYLTQLRQLCQSLGLDQRVVCLGFVAAEDLPLLLNSVDAFVMPSQAELQSIATLEAMASALPVLAANARALPELVTDGVNGYLVAPGDVAATVRGILTLLDHQLRWADMGAASRSRALPHDQTHSIRRYAEWYQQVSSKVSFPEPSLSWQREEAWG